MKVLLGHRIEANAAWQPDSPIPPPHLDEENAAVEWSLSDCHSEDMAATSQDIPKPEPAESEKPPSALPKPREIGGPKGPEPTRYGDWEVNGRCTDF
jgi:hypothetical protein